MLRIAISFAILIAAFGVPLKILLPSLADRELPFLSTTFNEWRLRHELAEIDKPSVVLIAPKRVRDAVSSLPGEIAYSRLSIALPSFSYSGTAPRLKALRVRNRYIRGYVIVEPVNDSWRISTIVAADEFLRRAGIKDSEMVEEVQAQDSRDLLGKLWTASDFTRTTKRYYFDGLLVELKVSNELSANTFDPMIAMGTQISPHKLSVVSREKFRTRGRPLQVSDNDLLPGVLLRMYSVVADGFLASGARDLSCNILAQLFRELSGLDSIRVDPSAQTLVSHIGCLLRRGNRDSAEKLLSHPSTPVNDATEGLVADSFSEPAMRRSLPQSTLDPQLARYQSGTFAMDFVSNCGPVDLQANLKERLAQWQCLARIARKHQGMIRDGILQGFVGLAAMQLLLDSGIDKTGIEEIASISQSNTKDVCSLLDGLLAEQKVDPKRLLERFNDVCAGVENPDMLKMRQPEFLAMMDRLTRASFEGGELQTSDLMALIDLMRFSLAPDQVAAMERLVDSNSHFRLETLARALLKARGEVPGDPEMIRFWKSIEDVVLAPHGVLGDKAGLEEMRRLARLFDSSEDPFICLEAALFVVSIADSTPGEESLRLLTRVRAELFDYFPEYLRFAPTLLWDEKVLPLDVEWLEKLTKAHGDDPGILDSLARLHEKLGNSSRAKQLYSKLLAGAGNALRADFYAWMSVADEKDPNVCFKVRSLVVTKEQVGGYARIAHELSQHGSYLMPVLYLPQALWLTAKVPRDDALEQFRRDIWVDVGESIHSSSSLPPGAIWLASEVGPLSPEWVEANEKDHEPDDTLTIYPACRQEDWHGHSPAVPTGSPESPGR